MKKDKSFMLVWFKEGQLLPSGSRFTGQTKPEEIRDELGQFMYSQTLYLYEVPQDDD